MNTEQENKYSVAWFSLSECIVRGEREKALGVFRLLSHSLADKALIHQLRGDIYSAFQDTDKATQEYLIAAQEYLSSNRLQSACFLYEYITSIYSELLDYSFILISLYYELSLSSRASAEIERIADQLSKKESFELVSSFVENVKNRSYAVSLYADIIRQLLLTAADEGYTQICVHAMLDVLIAKNDQNVLQHFLQTLESIDGGLYCKVLEYIKE